MAIRRSLFRFLSLSFILPAVVISGCGGGAENAPGSSPTASTGTPPAASPASTKAGGPRIIFVTNSNADWWNAMEKGMQDGAI
ncbi:MAG: hypothetical protein ACKO5E_14790, partial [bacterium]